MSSLDKCSLQTLSCIHIQYSDLLWPGGYDAWIPSGRLHVRVFDGYQQASWSGSYGNVELYGGLSTSQESGISSWSQVSISLLNA